MEQELIKRLFELTVEGNLIALKKVVEKHPNIHLSDCWTNVIKYKDREHRFCSITKYSRYTIVFIRLPLLVLAVTV